MIQVLVGEERVTGRLRALEWTSTDPGGFETATLQLTSADGITPGMPVRITDGMSTCWMGRVEEPGDQHTEHSEPGQIGAIGHGAAGKDEDASMVFIDRALDHWQGMSRQRRIDIGTTWDPVSGPTVEPDETTGAPALRLGVDGEIPGASGGICEAMYDAGEGNLIGALHFQSTEMKGIGGGAVWSFRIFGWDDDKNTNPVQEAGDYDDASVPFTRDIWSTAKRWAMMHVVYEATYTASADQRHRLVRNIAVIGNHGLTLQEVGAGQDGFLAGHIAEWALSRYDGVARGVVHPSGLIVPHSVYRDPVPLEQIVADMGTLTGYHWGVWEPASALSEVPTYWFTAPPEHPTASVSARDCHPRLAQRLSDFYNQARVRYTDPAGKVSSVLVTRANPRMPAGLTRTMPLDVGRGDSDYAETVGAAVLALSEQQARAAGEAALPPTVLGVEGVIPSHLLRPGRDRLKITGLDNAGPWTDADTRRFDTFRIKRLRCQLVAGGRVQTIAEVDSGANLIETLQARLALAAELASP